MIGAPRCPRGAVEIHHYEQVNITVAVSLTSGMATKKNDLLWLKVLGYAVCNLLDI